MAALERSACIASCSSHVAAPPIQLNRRRRRDRAASLNPTCISSHHLRDLHSGCINIRDRGTQICCASKGEPIQGYTPANYISYTDHPEHRCHHMLAIDVNAPASICFDLWDDWCRLVDFLDLVAQIGLDPEEPDMGLFQCFYRWGRMPVMEIVFLARKIQVEQDKFIAFDTVWGMPASGEITFVANSETSTTVIFKLEHQMPWLLVDLKVGTFGMEGQLREIFSENLNDFKQLAETLASDPSLAPPRQQPGETHRQAQQPATPSSQEEQPATQQPNPQQRQPGSQPGQPVGSTQQRAPQPTARLAPIASTTNQQAPQPVQPAEELEQPAARRRSKTVRATSASASVPSSSPPATTPLPPAGSPKRSVGKSSSRSKSRATGSPTI